jgi:predicted RNA binding protein YcfA (HicA-like mRNA interferase family)
MKYRDLIKLLRDDGWKRIRTTGSICTSKTRQAGPGHRAGGRQVVS